MKIKYIEHIFVTEFDCTNDNKNNAIIILVKYVGFLVTQGSILTYQFNCIYI